jgi:hypothetical protein
MRRPLLMTPVQIVLSFSLRGTENSKTQESSAGGASLFLPSLDNMARTRRERQISSGVKLLLCVPRGEHDWTSCVASRARGVTSQPSSADSTSLRDQYLPEYASWMYTLVAWTQLVRHQPIHGAMLRAEKTIGRN